ncbi:unnamed protein product [Moneuplotes crassus]|uniref:Uncharacterized protein n=2 Tax=Euplotes crassus TaxID=5936 RepID=A0AAD1U8B7_EUPCR|nr:unnamed protein product [Moneuplotes crassus]
MEKITTNREIVKITQLHPSHQRESDFVTEIRNKYESPEKINKILNDFEDIRPHSNSNATNTPLVQNYSISDSKNNMKELKLFSRVDSYQPTNTVYFSNKMLQKNAINPTMPLLNNSNYSNEYSKDESRALKQRGIFTSGTNNRSKDANRSQPRKKSNFVNHSQGTESLSKRMKRADLSSWGGYDYKNNDNCAPEGQYHTVNKARPQHISKNSKFSNRNVKIKPIGNKVKLINKNSVNIFLDQDGIVRPLFNCEENLDDSQRNINSPKSRGMRHQLEKEHSFSNATNTQTNYFKKREEMSEHKAAKSSSYSPSKKNLNKLNHKVIYQNKEDKFFYERSSTMVAEVQQNNDSSLSMIPSRKTKKMDKLILEHNENAKKFMAPAIQFKRRVNTGSKNPQAQGNLNCKSKVKKRLKFTMRNNKAISPKCKPKEKPCDLTFKVQGLSGFLNLSSDVYNDKTPANILDDVSSKIIITKPQNATRNNKNSSIKKYYSKESGSNKDGSNSQVQYMAPTYKNGVFYSNSNNTTNEIKSDSDTLNLSNTYAGDDSYSPEKRLGDARYLQPNHMHKSVLSKTASELPGMNDTKRIKMKSQTDHLNIPENDMGQSCFSESSSRMKSHHNMKKSRCTIITKCDGPRTCQSTQTKRLCMKRRAEMAGKPILIINFHGVLGCLRKSNSNIDDLCKVKKYYQQTQEKDVFIRQASGKNLKSLMGSFQIVLFINKYAKRHETFINIVESRVGDVFDAIYTRCSYKNDNKVVDYSQIYEDFCIKTEDIDNKVAVLCPINMETEEVKDREREELLFIDNTQNYCYKNIIAECIPMNSNACRNPLSILFASLRNDVFNANDANQSNSKGTSSKMMTFARLTRFLNIMMNAFEEEASKSSSKSDKSEEEDFSFIKGFKALQKLITKGNNSTLKTALFSTNKISQAVNLQKAKEDKVLKLRSEKKKKYKSQLEREEIHKKFIEYNFHLAKTNSYINLKSQNVHTSRHVNQYYNDFYYELIEKEEEDIEEKQNISSQIDHLLVQFQNFKIPDMTDMSLNSTRLYLNRFVALDHVIF